MVEQMNDGVSLSKLWLGEERFVVLTFLEDRPGVESQLSHL